MFRRTLLAAGIAAFVSVGASAGVSPDEAKQLGTTLTPAGAEKAGNKDSTIPAYTGGLTTPPASYQKGSKVRTDPFADEKPRLVITGKDIDANADKLTEGTKALLKRYPTMRLDVYPTHRTAALPQFVLDNTVKNAVGAKAAEGGLAVENALAGYPFPIPKTGAEAMWNHLLRYSGLGYDGSRYENWNVDAAGVATLAVAADAFWAWPIYDPKKTGTLNAIRSLLVQQASLRGPRSPQWRGPSDHRLGQSVEAAAKSLAVLAGTAPHAARTRSGVRHAESGRGRRGNVRRRVRVQRRDRSLRLEADRQEGDVRPVQQLSADLPQDRSRTSPRRTTSIPTSSAGSSIACGSSKAR